MLSIDLFLRQFFVKYKNLVENDLQKDNFFT